MKNKLDGCSGALRGYESHLARMGTLSPGNDEVHCGKDAEQESKGNKGQTFGPENRDKYFGKTQVLKPQPIAVVTNKNIEESQSDNRNTDKNQWSLPEFHNLPFAPNNGESIFTVFKDLLAKVDSYRLVLKH